MPGVCKRRVTQSGGMRRRADGKFISVRVLREPIWTPQDRETNRWQLDTTVARRELASF